MVDTAPAEDLRVSAAIVMFLALVVGHLIGDYPLQGDFLARTKNHRAPVAGVPWHLSLASHAAIQGGITAACTGSVQLGVAEYAAHSLIDYAKNAGWLGAGEHAYVLDQILHVASKLVWVSLLVSFR
jgi:hypothetical protein